MALCLDLQFAQGQARDLQKWNLAERWNSMTLQGMRDAKMGAPMAARALGIVHTCMYDAWAAYDEHAVGTQLRGALRRPASERTESNKERAISYAAYRALTDVLPVDTETAYKGLMRELGYDPKDNSTDISLQYLGTVAKVIPRIRNGIDSFAQYSRTGALIEVTAYPRLGLRFAYSRMIESSCSATSGAVRSQ
jgi:hypothetical protein